MLTQEELKKVLSYDVETGVFTWRISPARRIRVGTIAGCLEHTQYIRIRLYKTLYRAHRLTWLYVYGEFPNGMIDHIDGNRSNNKLENLRVCTNSENQLNRGKCLSNTSGFKGVHWSSFANKWRVTTTLNDIQYHLGYFSAKEEAVKVYNDFAKEHHGEFYRDIINTLPLV